MHKELQRIRHGYYDLWFGTNAVYERWAKSHGLNNNLLLTDPVFAEGISK